MIATLRLALKHFMHNHHLRRRRRERDERDERRRRGRIRRRRQAESGVSAGEFVAEEAEKEMEEAEEAEGEAYELTAVEDAEVAVVMGVLLRGGVRLPNHSSRSSLARQSHSSFFTSIECDTAYATSASTLATTAAIAAIRAIRAAVRCACTAPMYCTTESTYFAQLRAAWAATHAARSCAPILRRSVST